MITVQKNNFRANSPALMTQSPATNVVEQNKSKASVMANSRGNDTAQVYYSSAVNFTSAIQMNKPVAVISFGSLSPDSTELYIGAELPPYFKKGGVATVMNDYRGPHMMPYYNGKMEYGPTGEPVSAAKVHKLPDGTPFFTNQDLDVVSIDDVIKSNDYWRLEEVSKKNMPWSTRDNDEIILYKVVHKDKDVEKAAKAGKKIPDHFMVYTDATASMKAPYEGGGYYSSASPSYSSNSGEGAASSANWEGDAYAKFDKAATELIPDIKNHKIKTVICSDAQTAYIPYYMAQKALKGDAFYQDAKPTFVSHNMQPGYTGATSNKNMLVNLAESPEQLKAIMEDPEYVNVLKNGTTEEYFANFVKETHDAFNKPNATMITLKLREQDYLAAFTTVAEEYADAAASNPMVAPELYPTLKKLKEEGKFTGILNPLNDPDVDPYKPLPLSGYGNSQTVVVDGVEETIDAMKVFTPEMTLDEVLAVKKNNMKNLFNRLSGKYDQNTVLTGLKQKKATLVGTIDPKWTQSIDKGEDVKLFVSWGRGDFQKGLDTVLLAFEKFAKTNDGDGQMLVLFQPAGSMEDFFFQMSKLGKEIPKNQEQVLKELWEAHGMKIVGPPLQI